MQTFYEKWYHNIVHCLTVSIPIEITGGGTAVCFREGEDDELYKPPYVNMPGNGGHWEFYNDRSHAERYFEEKHPQIAQFRKKIYDKEVSWQNYYY